MKCSSITTAWLLLERCATVVVDGFAPVVAPTALSRQKRINTVLQPFFAIREDDPPPDWDGIGESSKEPLQVSNDLKKKDENNKSFDTNQLAGDNKQEPEIYHLERKFTGAPTKPPLFSQQQPSNANQAAYEREFNLASVFEQTLPLQALGLLAAICIVAYVGFSGGITDGSDRILYRDDEVDETLQPDFWRDRDALPRVSDTSVFL